MSDTFEGAGVVSSVADYAEAVSADHVDPMQVAFTATGAGLDMLGTLADPLGTLMEAGIGWLIEHVGFLSEPLDALAGDPDAVLAQAQAWHIVSVELGAIAAGYRAASGPAGWDGAAAGAYAVAAAGCVDRLESAARDAEQLANVVVTTGAAVGTVRSLVRDLIAKFVSNVIQWVVAALGAATVTAGFSLAALVAAVVEQAVSLARMLVRQLTDVLDMLAEATVSANRLATALAEAAMDPKVLVEAGKQVTDAEQEQRGWGVNPAAGAPV